MPESALADSAEYLPLIADKGASVWLFQVLMSAAALGLAVFGAGLRRRLDEQEPVGSLVPTLALVGLLLAAGLCLVGGGISTELFWQLENADKTDPDTVLANVGILNTMGWVWAGVGLSAGAVAWAGITHESVGRRLAWFSAVMATLIGDRPARPVAVPGRAARGGVVPRRRHRDGPHGPHGLTGQTWPVRWCPIHSATLVAWIRRTGTTTGDGARPRQGRRRRRRPPRAAATGAPSPLRSCWWPASCSPPWPSPSGG